MLPDGTKRIRASRGHGGVYRRFGRRNIHASQLRAAAPLLGLKLSARKAAQAVRMLAEFRRVSRTRRCRPTPREIAPAVTLSVVPAPPAEDPGLARLRSVSASPDSEEPVPPDSEFATLGQLRVLLDSGTVTSVGLTELALSRLEKYGPELECVATLCSDRALEQARRMDRELAEGVRRGPLHGIPWGAKDLFDTAGIATSYGAEPFRGRVPARDAAVVRALDEAGAVLVAKLSLGALAYGDIWYGGRTNNPWDRSQGSSGSSAGSAAAVVAGLVPFALGTETMGSIISPSLTCGAAGLRPTFGRVSRDGAMPLCWSYDKIGPICRTAACTATVFEAIHGVRDKAASEGDPDCVTAPFESFGLTSLHGVRVGLLSTERMRSGEYAARDTQVLEQARSTIRDLGGEAVDLSLPPSAYETMILPVYAEAAASFESLTGSGADDRMRRQAVEAWPNVFRSVRFLSAIEYIEAQRLRRVIALEIDAVCEQVDAVLAPGGAEEMLLATNGSGHPSLTIRTGFDAAGMPVGATLYGRWWEESTIVAIGERIEAAMGAARRRPPDYDVGE